MDLVHDVTVDLIHSLFSSQGPQIPEWTLKSQKRTKL